MAQGRIEGFQPEVLQHHMDNRSMSHTQLAAALGTSNTVVGRWTRGLGAPSIDNALLLADIFGIDVLELSGKTLETADLLNLRQRLGLSATEVAAAIDRSRPWMYHVEAAVSIPSDEVFDRLAPVYKRTPTQIRQAWIRRRVNLFGPGSLPNLPDDLVPYIPDDLRPSDGEGNSHD